MKKWIGIGVAVTMLSGVLAGCSNTEEPKDAGNNTGGGTDSLAAEQVLNLHIPGEPSTLDSSKLTDATSGLILGHVGEGLVRIDKDGKAQPGMAEKWEVTPDGLTYTFHLRDTKWSDGSAVTANDWVYAWKRSLDPKTASQYSFLLEWIKGGSAFNKGQGSADDVQVIAKDDKTLVVTLETPRPYFVEVTAMPQLFPQKKEYVEKTGDKYGADADKMIFNGPFKLESWTHEQSLHIVKNDGYWDADKVKLKDVTWTVIKDPNAQENLYESGQLDRMTLVREQVERYKDKPEYATIPELTNAYLQYNQKKVPAFKSANVRKALTYAIDTQKYVEIVLGNGSVSAEGFVPVGVSAGEGQDFRKLNGDQMKRAENHPKAKELLAAGLKEVGLTELPKITLLSDDTDSAKKSAEFLKEQWRQNLGIEVEIEHVPSKLRFKRSADGDFQMVLSLWGADYNDPMTFLDLWLTDSPFNENGYSNPKYDELIKAANVEVDTKKRMQQLQDAEKILMEDMGVGPIYFRSTPMVLNKKVKNWQDNTAGLDYDLKYTYIAGE